MEIEWGKHSSISNETIHHLREKALSNKRLSRICVHDSEESPLHIMLIAMPPNCEYPKHMHKTRDEFYTILKGDLTIVYVEDNNVNSTCTLSENSNLHKCLFLRARIWHSVKSGTEGCVFVESRLGPFSSSDTIYQ